MKSNDRKACMQFSCCLRMGTFDTEPGVLAMRSSFDGKSNKTTHRFCSSQNHRKPPFRPASTAKSGAFKNQKEKELCLVKLNSQGKIGYFCQPVSASRAPQLLSAPQNFINEKERIQTNFPLKNVLNDSNVFSFDHVFDDDDVAERMYNRTFSQAVARVFKGENSTAFVIGDRDCRRKKRFFTDNTSLFRKFLEDTRSKFEIFKKCDENEKELKLKGSIFGFVNGNIYDFLQQTKIGNNFNEKASSAQQNHQKVSRAKINRKEEIDVFLEQLRAAFGVIKSLSQKGKSLILVIKVFVDIRDKTTKVKIKSAESNFVLFDCSFFDKNLLESFKTNLLQVRLSQITQKKNTKLLTTSKNTSSLKHSSAERLTPQEKILRSIFSADLLSFFFCFNALFKNSEKNKTLLDFYKQLRNEIALLENLSADGFTTGPKTNPAKNKADKNSKLSRKNNETNNLVQTTYTIDKFDHCLSRLEQLACLKDVHSQDLEPEFDEVVQQFKNVAATFAENEIADYKRRINSLAKNLSIDFHPNFDRSENDMRAIFKSNCETNNSFSKAEDDRKNHNSKKHRSNRKSAMRTSSANPQTMTAEQNDQAYSESSRSEQEKTQTFEETLKTAPHIKIQKNYSLREKVDDVRDDCSNESQNDEHNFAARRGSKSQFVKNVKKRQHNIYSDYKNLQSEHELVKTVNAQLNTKIQESNVEFNKHQQQRVELLDQIVSLNKEILSLKESKNCLENDSEEKNKLIDSLKDEINKRDKNIRENQDTREQMLESKTEKISRLESKIAKRDDKLKRISKQNEILNSNISTLNDELEIAQKRTHELQRIRKKGDDCFAQECEENISLREKMLSNKKTAGNKRASSFFGKRIATKRTRKNKKGVA